VKYIYLLRDGKNKTISAKTRSWEKAEEQAREIRDGWDPVKQKLRELEELQQAQEVGEVTITYALERWLSTVKSESDSENEHTHSKYQTAAKQIQAWAHSNQFPLLSGRYEGVIAATYAYDENARRPSDMFGEDLRAIIELMRWTGLRIGDALLCARSPNRR
jgi:hypothetical protein